MPRTPFVPVSQQAVDAPIVDNLVGKIADLFNGRIESPSIRRILVGAVDSFSRIGFHAASTRDIAKKAGLSPAPVLGEIHARHETKCEIH